MSDSHSSGWMMQLLSISLLRVYPRDGKKLNATEFTSIPIDSLHQLLTGEGLFDCGSALSTAISYILSSMNPSIAEYFTTLTISTTGIMDENTLIRSLPTKPQYANQSRLTYLQYNVAYNMLQYNIPSTNAMGYWIVILEDDSCLYYNDEPSPSFQQGSVDDLKKMIEVTFGNDIERQAPHLMHILSSVKGLMRCNKQDLFEIDPRHDHYLPNLDEMTMSKSNMINVRRNMLMTRANKLMGGDGSFDCSNGIKDIQVPIGNVHTLDLWSCQGITDLSDLGSRDDRQISSCTFVIIDIRPLVFRRDPQISYSQLQLNRNLEKMYKNGLYSYDHNIVELYKKYLKKKRQVQKKYNREQYQLKLKHNHPRVQKRIGCQPPPRYKKRQ